MSSSPVSEMSYAPAERTARDDGPAIEAILVDYAGVLTNPLRELYAAFSRACGLSLDEIALVMTSAAIRFGRQPLEALEVGAISEQRFLELIDGAAKPSCTDPSISPTSAGSGSPVWSRTSSSSNTCAGCATAATGSPWSPTMCASGVRCGHPRSRWTSSKWSSTHPRSTAASQRLPYTKGRSSCSRSTARPVHSSTTSGSTVRPPSNWGCTRSGFSQRARRSTSSVASRPPSRTAGKEIGDARLPHHRSRLGRMRARSPPVGGSERRCAVDRGWTPR